MDRIQLSRRNWIILVSTPIIIIAACALIYYITNKNSNELSKDLQPKEAIQKIGNLRIDLGKRETLINNTQSQLKKELDQVKQNIVTEKSVANITTAENAFKNRIIMNNLIVMQRASAYIDVIQEEKDNIKNVSIDLNFLESQAKLDLIVEEGLQDKEKTREIIAKVDGIIKDVEPNVNKTMTPLAEKKKKPLKQLWDENFEISETSTKVPAPGIPPSPLPSAAPLPAPGIPPALPSPPTTPAPGIPPNLQSAIPHGSLSSDASTSQPAREITALPNRLDSFPENLKRTKRASNPAVNKKLQWAIARQSGKISLSEARTYCNNLDFEGYTDWRLPSFIEYEVRHNRPKELRAYPYWTSTPCSKGYYVMEETAFKCLQTEWPIPVINKCSVICVR